VVSQPLVGETLVRVQLLVVFGGLPATGKSTLAARLAEELGSVYLRIDTIEQAMRDMGQTVSGPEGCLVARALAEDNLRQGKTVVVDAVNPIELVRNYWRGLAGQLDIRLVEVQTVCSDKAEHRNRVETRVADIPGHQLPDWQQVLDREFEPWEGAVVINTSGQTVAQSVAAIRGSL
jgi:predicted kinase